MQSGCVGPVGLPAGFPGVTGEGQKCDECAVTSGDRVLSPLLDGQVTPGPPPGLDLCNPRVAGLQDTNAPGGWGAGRGPPSGREECFITDVAHSPWPTVIRKVELTFRWFYYCFKIFLRQCTPCYLAWRGPLPTPPLPPILPVATLTPGVLSKLLFNLLIIVVGS